MINVEDMFWMMEFDVLVNMLISGEEVQYKNIRDPAKIARRLASLFDRQQTLSLYRRWEASNGGKTRQDELLEVAEFIEARREAERISKHVKPTNGLANRRGL